MGIDLTRVRAATAMRSGRIFRGRIEALDATPFEPSLLHNRIGATGANWGRDKEGRQREDFYLARLYKDNASTDCLLRRWGDRCWQGAPAGCTDKGILLLAGRR